MVNVFFSKDETALSFERYCLINKLDKYIKINFKTNPELIDSINKKTLFEDKLPFIVDNATFLINNNEENLKIVDDLVKSNKQIYCFVVSEKVYQNNKYVKLNKVSQFNNSSKQQLINEMMNEFACKFDNNNTLSYLQNILMNDQFNIRNEVNKLFLFANDKIITKPMIDDVVRGQENANIFELFFLFLNKKRETLIEMYEKLILDKFQPLELLSVMVNQLFNFKLFLLAKKKYWNDLEITEKLGINYYSQKNFKLLKNDISSVDLLLDECALLEYNMKHNNTNHYLMLKFYLAK